MADPVQQQAPNSQQPFEVQRMGLGGFLGTVLYGVGVSLGLALLWLMEIVRNTVFRTLDRLNIKPRRRGKASAFPPGQPRKRPHAPASS